MLLQSGTYAVTPGSITLVSGQSLIGMGRSQTILRASAATGDILTIGSGAQHVHIAHLGFDSSVTRTAGFAVNQTGNNALFHTFEDIYVTNQYNGINMSADGQTLRDSFFSSIVHDAVLVGPEATAGNTHAVIANCEMWNPGANTNIHCTGANAGMFITNCDLENANTSIEIDGTGVTNGVVIEHTSIDGGGTGTAATGIDIGVSGGTLADIKIRDCWIAGLSGQGINVGVTGTPTCVDLGIYGCHIASNGGFGMALNSWPGDAQAIGNYIGGNTSSGLELNSAGAFLVSVLGNRFISNGAYGVVIFGSTYATGSVITQNTFHGNTSGTTNGTATNLTNSGNYS